MATFSGVFEDAEGNKYFSECAASDVKMSDNTTAQEKIDEIDSKYTALQAQINRLNTQFQAVLDA